MRDQPDGGGGAKLGEGAAALAGGPNLHALDVRRLRQVIEQQVLLLLLPLLLGAGHDVGRVLGGEAREARPGAGARHAHLGLGRGEGHMLIRSLCI